MKQPKHELQLAITGDYTQHELEEELLSAVFE